MNISTETGCTFDEADDSVLVVCSQTGKDLGNIDEFTAIAQVFFQAAYK